MLPPECFPNGIKFSARHVGCRERLRAEDADMAVQCSGLQDFLHGMTFPQCTKPSREGMAGFYSSLETYYATTFPAWQGWPGETHICSYRATKGGNRGLQGPPGNVDMTLFTGWIRAVSTVLHRANFCDKCA